MSARERALIYVDSSSSSLSSLMSSGSSIGSLSSSGSPIGGSSTIGGRHGSSGGGSNYVIKIQIGEEGLFNRPVRIDVAGGNHRQRKLIHHITSSDGDGDSLSLLDSSGQSSPRSDMTPPPPQRHNVIKGTVRHGSSSCRFGSETSESDTESDISAEYPHSLHSSDSRCSTSVSVMSSSRQTARSALSGKSISSGQQTSAAQFARREILNSIDSGTFSCACASGNPDDEHSEFCFEDLSTLKENLNASLMKAFAAAQQGSVPCFTPPCRPDGTEGQAFDLRMTSVTPPCMSSVMTESLLKSKIPLSRIPETEQLLTFAPRKMEIDQESFHLQEFKEEDDLSVTSTETNPSLTSSNFAGYKDIFSRVHVQGQTQIMSEKGTIRGVKNRVRDGIATFLQSTDSKNYNEKEQGRVVVYVTSMGVVRDTYQRCQKVKQILRNLLVKFDERDCYMNQAVQEEIRQRFPMELRQKEFQRQKELNNFRGVPRGVSRNGPGASFFDIVTLPQVFVEGQYLGDAETIEKLNESGELRKILQPYKNVSVLTTCDNCGGYRMLPCPICNGSKKSVHRNHFTEEFVALKCMHCDQAGLVKCQQCNA